LTLLWRRCWRPRGQAAAATTLGCTTTTWGD
jgi:hypothetical protein